MDKLIEDLCSKYLGKDWDARFNREKKLCDKLDSREGFDELYPEEDNDDR